ncbi:MAG: DUF4870 domain-containing protein [Thermoanaerobaculia bacterium]
MSDIPPPTVPPATPPPPGGGSYTPPPPPPGGSYTPPPGGGAAAPPGSDRTLMVVLAYLWLLALIPLLTKKEDPDVQWHAKNGMVLMGAEIVVWIVFGIVGWALRSTMIGCGLATVQCIVWLAFLALHIVAIMKAVAGQRLRVPVISDFADKM